MYLRCPWNVMCITQTGFVLIFLPLPPSTSNASVGHVAYMPSCRLFFMLLFSATCKHPCCLICLFCEEYIFSILPHFPSFSLKSITCIGMLVTIFFSFFFSIMSCVCCLSLQTSCLALLNTVLRHFPPRESLCLLNFSALHIWKCLQPALICEW